MKLLDKFRGLIEDCETFEELDDVVESLSEDYREELDAAIQDKRSELSGSGVTLSEATDAELAAEIEDRPDLLEMLEEAHFSDQSDDQDLDEEDDLEDSDEEDDQFDPAAARQRVESFADADEDVAFADALLSEDLDTGDTLIVKDVVDGELQPIPSAVSYTEQAIKDADLSDEEMETALDRLDELKRETGLLETDASRQTAKEAAEHLNIDIPKGATTEQILTRINEDAPDVTQDAGAPEEQDQNSFRDLMTRALHY